MDNRLIDKNELGNTVVVHKTLAVQIKELKVWGIWDEGCGGSLILY